VASTPDYASQILADVRAQIAVDDEILSETKARRNLVKRVARRFPGALKTFDSGSVAHGTVNRLVADADCGVVLCRAAQRAQPLLDDRGARRGRRSDRAVRNRAVAGQLMPPIAPRTGRARRIAAHASRFGALDPLHRQD